MKKIDFGQGLTILANIGVIAGIVFLAIEINQNTRSLEVGAYQQLMGQISRLNELNLEHPEAFATIREHAESDLADLSPQEYEDVTSIALLVIRHGDMAFHQAERNLITDERFESALGPLKDSICRPIYQDVWAEFRHNFLASFQKYVDSRIVEC